jgi:hypothetical protein
MDALSYIARKFNLHYTEKTYIEIPNIGRNGLAELFAELDFKTGVEVGVKEGDYSLILCQSIPALKLFSIDPWTVRDDYNDGRGQELFDRFEKTARERLSPYDCTILKMKSSEAVQQFKPDSIDFVYIDGHHNFFNVVHDVHEWSQRVRPGGIISGHDYAFYKPESNIHVHEVVDAWTKAYHIKPWFVLGRKERQQGEYRDKYRSFFWVKPLDRKKIHVLTPELP